MVYVAGWIIVTCVGSLCLTIETYCVWVFRIEKNAVYFVKRHNKTVWCTIVLTYFTTMRMLFAYYYYSLLQNSSLVSMGILHFLVYCPCSIISKLFTLRLWLYYYDLKFNKFNRNKEWRMIIDYKNESNINKKFLENYQKYCRNEKYLITIIVCVSIIESIAVSYTGIINWVASVIISTLSYLIEACIINVYLIFGKIVKVKEYYGRDSLGLKYELYLVIIAVLILFICAVVINIAIEDDKGYHGIKFLFQQCFFIVELCCFMCIFVLYPRYYYYNYSRISKQSKYNNIKINSLTNGRLRIFSKSKSKSKSKSNSKSVIDMGDIDLIGAYYDKISWTKLITFYDGFEAIMNHLEKEFSMENLLFIQEYIQVKNVLREFFNPIVNKLYNNNNSHENNNNIMNSPSSTWSSNSGIIDNLQLPPTTRNQEKNSNKSNNSRNSNINININTKFNVNNVKTIPESAIAKQLRKKLSIWTLTEDLDPDLDKNNNDSTNYNSYDLNRKADIKSKHICDDIITAFVQIYNKYIKDECAIYMINISSSKRKKIEYLLDHDLFEKLENDDDIFDVEHVENDDENMETATCTRTKFSFKFSLSRSSKQAKDRKKMTFVKQKLETYIKENVMIVNIKEFDLIEWLLRTIMIPMDENLIEIVFLINDSFTRFKMQNKELFDCLCHHIDV